MSLVLFVVLGVVMALLGVLGFLLSDYLNKVEDGKYCEQCSCSHSCFAKRKFPGGKYFWLDEFMLISFLKVQSYCVVDQQWKKKSVVAYFFAGLILMFLLLGFNGVCLTTILYMVCTGALLLLTVVDWKTQYIPFECDVLIFICGLIQLFNDFTNWKEYVIGLFAVSGFFFLVNKVATPIMSKRYGEEIDQVLGDGDIKLMAATGLLLGWKLNFLALAIGCIAGSVIHCILMKIKKGERQLSFGPYLSLGIYMTMVCGEQLISWYLSIIGVQSM